MSLLFDALNRAQDNGNRVQDKDAEPLHLPSDTDTAGQAEGVAAAKSLLSASNKPHHNILPYSVAGVALLVGVAAWFFYQENQLASVTPLYPAPPIALSDQALSASQLAAASSVADTESATAKLLVLADAPTGAGASSDSSADTAKPWTRPVTTKHRTSKKRTASRKASRANITSRAGTDPLQEGYRALSEGRLEQAEQHYQLALAQHPHEKDALLGLAVIAQRKMQTQRAADLYQQVLREDLGNVPAAAGLVSLSEQADPVAAESQLRQLLDLKPSAAEFHYALGNVLARQLRWGEAQQAFFRAHSLTPDNARYAYNLAVSLDHLHQPAVALSYYETAAKLSKPGDPTLSRDAVFKRIQELKPTVPESH